MREMISNYWNNAGKFENLLIWLLIAEIAVMLFVWWLIYTGRLKKIIDKFLEKIV